MVREPHHDKQFTPCPRPVGKAKDPRASAGIEVPCYKDTGHKAGGAVMRGQSITVLMMNFWS